MNSCVLVRTIRRGDPVERLDQVLIGASEGDAITSMAFNIQTKLKAQLDSEIFACFIDPSVVDRVKPIDELASVNAKSPLIYHSSYGLREITARLITHRGPLFLCYHNLTPPEFFEDLDPEFAEGLRWGKEELTYLRPKVVHAFADSTFNAQDLVARGYDSISVVPVGVDSDKLCEFEPDIRLANFYNHIFPNGYVIVVSQLLPHKRMEHAIATVHQLREVWEMDLGLVIVGVARSGDYAAAVTKFANHLLGDRYRMTGRLNDRQLSTLLRHARLYLGFSSHEGLSLPLIDAMALGTPAIVRDAGAIRETAGSGALVLDASTGPVEAAAAAVEILTRPEVMYKQTAAGFRRAADFRRDNLLEPLLNTLEKNQV